MITTIMVVIMTLTKNNKLTDQQKIDVVKEYIENPNIKCPELGKKYGIHGNSIARLLKRRGIKIRNDPSSIHRKYTLDESFFDIVDTEEKAYFLGFLYADGCNFPPNNIIIVNIQERDREILEKFNVLLKSNNPIKFINAKKRNPKWQNNSRLEFQGKRISKRLVELGVVPAKSLILKFPTEDQVPEHLLRYFIRGMYDGDGGISFGTYNDEGFKVLKSKCHITSTYDFCNKLKEKTIKIISSSISRFKNRSEVTSTWSVGGCKQTCKFLDWLYKDSKIHLKRKYDKYLAFRAELDKKGLLRKYIQEGITVPIS